jgi:hypothetical protein
VASLVLTIGCSGAPTSPPPPTTVMPAATPPPMMLWPVIGVEGRDWVINSYVDLDPSSGIKDYTGATGANAKTANGHLGIDIDSPNFRWMDAGVPLVVAAASGVVTNLGDGAPDRNMTCQSAPNFVHVRHADNSTALYYHLKKGSVAVTQGQQVSAGDVLGIAGSSGCSLAPHLHFELRDATNVVVDPFAKGLWIAPPTYSPPLTLMDLVIAAGTIFVEQVKDPAPNVTSVPAGSTISVGVSAGGGSIGDVIKVVLTGPSGAAFFENPLVFTSAPGHSYWIWKTQLSSAPGVWTVSIFINGALVRSETLIAHS